MRKIVLFASVFAFSAVLFIGLTSKTSGTGPTAESQCVKCHTDAKRLIRLSWEIEKIRPKPAKSALTSGEG
jgi:hypothetical protein